MKKKSCFLIILIILFIIFGVNVSRLAKEGKMPLLSRGFSYMAKPFVYSGNTVKNKTYVLISYLKNINQTTKELEELKAENIKLKIENDTLKSIAYQYTDLEKLLNFEEPISFTHKGGRILYFSPTHWYKNATIDVGEKQGAKVGLAIVNSKGILGQISKVSLNSSVIESITNEKTAIGGIIMRSGVKGLVIGDGSDNLIFTYLKMNIDIKKGDIVSTYGDNSLIPSGVPIGKIIDIKQDKLRNSSVASIKPFCEFNSAEHIFVMVQKEK